MASFARDFLMPALGMCAVAVLVVVGLAWFGHVINSIARAADALERIADAIEDNEDEDTKEEGGAK